MVVDTSTAADGPTQVRTRRVPACSEGANSSATPTCWRPAVRGCGCARSPHPRCRSESTSGSSRSTRTSRGRARHGVDHARRPRGPGSRARTRHAARITMTIEAKRHDEGEAAGGDRHEVARSARYGYGGEDAVEHTVGGGALRARLRAATSPGGAASGFTTAFTSSGVTKSPTGQPRPRLGRVQQASGAAG